jgi:hypothetical protein
MCTISGKGNFEGNGEIFMDRLLYSGPTVRNLASDCQKSFACRNRITLESAKFNRPGPFFQEFGYFFFPVVEQDSAIDLGQGPREPCQNVPEAGKIVQICRHPRVGVELKSLLKWLPKSSSA